MLAGCARRYMRLLGYPAASISVLTSYNGQKALLRDVIERRCAHNPLFGRPHKVAPAPAFAPQLRSLLRHRPRTAAFLPSAVSYLAVQSVAMITPRS